MNLFGYSQLSPLLLVTRLGVDVVALLTEFLAVILQLDQLQLDVRPVPVAERSVAARAVPEGIHHVEKDHGILSIQKMTKVETIPISVRTASARSFYGREEKDYSQILDKHREAFALPFASFGPRWT